LHLGHAYSALLAHDMALAHDGTLILRIEDTDTARCRPAYDAAIYEDLSWLGIDWETPVWRQSERLRAYQQALDRLIAGGLCYPCGCSRRDIRAALAAPQETAAQDRANTAPYPGTCRHRPMSDRGAHDAIRLNMAKALEFVGDTSALVFSESGPVRPGEHHLGAQDMLEQTGDIILARRDIGATAYHLSVVVDDAAQNITCVVRGEDLFEATFIHRLLQALLGLATPDYHHHTLVRDGAGKRLAKRDDALAIATLRAQGQSPHDIRRRLGLAPNSL
jgi:glutamyl-Q tRNA(Asp) synthetase